MGTAGNERAKSHNGGEKKRESDAKVITGHKKKPGYVKTQLGKENRIGGKPRRPGSSWSRERLDRGGKERTTETPATLDAQPLKRYTKKKKRKPRKKMRGKPRPSFLEWEGQQNGREAARSASLNKKETTLQPKSRRDLNGFSVKTEGRLVELLRKPAGKSEEKNSEGKKPTPRDTPHLKRKNPTPQSVKPGQTESKFDHTTRRGVGKKRKTQKGQCQQYLFRKPRYGKEKREKHLTTDHACRGGAPSKERRDKEKFHKPNPLAS